MPNSVLLFEEVGRDLEQLMRNYSENVEGNIKVFTVDYQILIFFYIYGIL